MPRAREEDGDDQRPENHLLVYASRARGRLLRPMHRLGCEGEVPAHRIRLAIGDVQSAIAACELERDEEEGADQARGERPRDDWRLRHDPI